LDRTGNSAKFEKQHRTRRQAFGEFTYPTMHCGLKPDLWQAGIDFRDEKKPDPEYFLVRWGPPYWFSMVDVSNRPWAGCTERDPEADEDRTLFAGQDWR